MKKRLAIAIVAVALLIACTVFVHFMGWPGFLLLTAILAVWMALVWAICELTGFNEL